MTTLNIQNLLTQRSAFMRRQCPAYQLDAVLMGALRPMLCKEPTPFGPLFCTYDQLAQAHHLQNCLSTYLHTKKLAEAASLGVFPLPPNGELSQEDLLAFAPRPRALIQAQKALWRAAGDGQTPSLSFYVSLAIDMRDFEQMFCAFFGCQAGAPDPKYESWVRRTILPDRHAALSWWAMSEDGNA